MSKITAAEELKEICKVLKPLGIVKVIVRYSGSGDSGAVDTTEFLIKGDDAYVGQLPDISEDSEPDQKPGDRLLTIIENNAIEFIEGDWYNNEGGQGVITLNVLKQKITVEAEYNVMEVERNTEEITL